LTKKKDKKEMKGKVLREYEKMKKNENNINERKRN